MLFRSPSQKSCSQYVDILSKRRTETEELKLTVRLNGFFPFFPVSSKSVSKGMGHESLRPRESLRGDIIGPSSSVIPRTSLNPSPLLLGESLRL